jgi:hypothetical protein
MTDFKVLESKIKELERRIVELEKKMMIDIERAAKILDDLKAEGVVRD